MFMFNFTLPNLTASIFSILDIIRYVRLEVFMAGEFSNIFLSWQLYHIVQTNHGPLLSTHGDFIELFGCVESVYTL